MTFLVWGCLLSPQKECYLHSKQNCDRTFTHFGSTTPGYSRSEYILHFSLEKDSPHTDSICRSISVCSVFHAPPSSPGHQVRCSKIRNHNSKVLLRRARTIRVGRHSDIANRCGNCWPKPGAEYRQTKEPFSGLTCTNKKERGLVMVFFLF